MAQAPRSVFVGTASSDRSADTGGDAASHEQVAFWDLVGQLPAEVRDLAKAEVALYRAEAVKKAIGFGAAIGFLVGALLIAGSAITALLVGLILTIATLTGPGLATLAVVVGALALAGLLAWLGIKKFGGSDETEKS